MQSVPNQGSLLRVFHDILKFEVSFLGPQGKKSMFLLNRTSLIATLFLSPREVIMVYIGMYTFHINNNLYVRSQMSCAVSALTSLFRGNAY